MSLSGIVIPEAIIKRYDEKRFERKAGGLVLCIKNEELLIENETSANFTDLTSKLPKAEPRYILLDVPVKNRANIEDLRTVFIFWMPMESPVSLRMSYASTKSAITREFRGISLQLQVDDLAEMTMDYIVKNINRKQGINNP